MILINRHTKMAALFCVLFLISCKQEGNRLVVVENNEQYGYIDTKGDTVIDCIYPLAYTDTISNIGFVADNKGNIKCFNNKGQFLFYTYKYDNGPDYPSDGLFRIVDAKGLIGFADTLGNIVIRPQFRFAFPSINGKAKVTNAGKSEVIDSLSIDNHTRWVSSNWYYIRTKD